MERTLTIAKLYSSATIPSLHALHTMGTMCNAHLLYATTSTLCHLQQGQGPYSLALKKIETELRDIQKRVDLKMGVKESDTGLAAPNLWDTQADKQRQGEHTLLVARCSKIIKASEWSKQLYLLVFEAYYSFSPSRRPRTIRHRIFIRRCCFSSSNRFRWSS